MISSQFPCQRIYETDMSVGKKLPINGRHTFPNEIQQILLFKNSYQHWDSFHS